MTRPDDPPIAMPLRDFTCNACGHAFERLLRGDAAPACPNCGASDLRRELSAFAVGGGAPPPVPAGCGACGAAQAGACRHETTH